MRRDSCDYCRHAGDYWPMYVGDDERKWGTIKCSKKKRRVLPFGCKDFKREGEEVENAARRKDRK